MIDSCYEIWEYIEGFLSYPFFVLLKKDRLLCN